MTKPKKTKEITKRPMEFAEGDEQLYGVVEKALGDRKFNVKCIDNITRRCFLRSKRIKGLKHDPAGVTVVVSLRDFDPKNSDIIWVYTQDETRILKNQKLIPDWNSISESIGNLEVQDDDIAFDFEEI